MSDLFGLFFRDQHKGATLDEFENMGSRLSAWALREHNEDGTHNVRPSGFDFVPIGGLIMWASNTPPESWLICDGSAVLRTTYEALFNVIGTLYGIGDGSTTFNLPDLRQKFPLGKAASGTGATLGATGGAIDHTHTAPAHTHGPGTLTVASHHHSVAGLSTSFAIESPTPSVEKGTTGLFTNIASPDHFHNVLTGDTSDVAPAVNGGATASDGGGTTGTANAPYVTVNYIILTGT